MTSAAHIETWIDRIERLPDYVVRDACRTVAGADLNVRKDLADQLEQDRQRKPSYLRDCRSVVRCYLLPELG